VTAVLGSLHEEVRSLDASLQPSLHLLRRANSRHAASGAASSGTATSAASPVDGGRVAGQPATSAASTNSTSLAAPGSSAPVTRSRKKSLNDYAPKLLDIGGGGENGNGAGPTIPGNSVRKNSKASLER
jgi:hypothetical protein